jgi:hypothetical protein
MQNFLLEFLTIRNVGRGNICTLEAKLNFYIPHLQIFLIWGCVPCFYTSSLATPWNQMISHFSQFPALLNVISEFAADEVDEGQENIFFFNVAMPQPP